VDPPTTAILPISSRHGREAAQATVKLKPTSLLLRRLRLHLQCLLCLCWLLLCCARLCQELFVYIHLDLHPLALLPLEQDSPLLMHRLTLLLLLLLLLHFWGCRLQQQL
jgi:hypothetical protein